MRQQDKRRGGFTMVELIVVIGMMLVLAASVTSAVGSSSRRIKAQQALTEAEEMTKAILMYENTGRVNERNPLGNHTMEAQPATEGNMAFILGQEKRQDGQDGNVEVLYNADVKKGAIRDPWGNPYYVTIREAKIDPDQKNPTLKCAVMFPNINRLPADER